MIVAWYIPVFDSRVYRFDSKCLEPVLRIRI
jgi:hypothetical protein